jgi:hypothetical protein
VRPGLTSRRFAPARTGNRRALHGDGVWTG